MNLAPRVKGVHADAVRLMHHSVGSAHLCLALAAAISRPAFCADDGRVSFQLQIVQLRRCLGDNLILFSLSNAEDNVRWIGQRDTQQVVAWNGWSGTYSGRVEAIDRQGTPLNRFYSFHGGFGSYQDVSAYPVWRPLGKHASVLEAVPDPGDWHDERLLEVSLTVHVPVLTNLRAPIKPEMIVLVAHQRLRVFHIGERCYAAEPVRPSRGLRRTSG